MASLDKSLRSDLEKAVREARKVGVTGGFEALAASAVDRKEAFPHMSREENTLRNRLRAHGRTLGDIRSGVTGKQSIDHLAHAVAYEHWHRMLFARFLAENECLIEPESRVAVSLSQVGDLAHEEKVGLWDLAGRYAEEMLPQIFRSDDPVLAIPMPPETRLKLEKLLADLPKEIFVADDSLGWVYQFWQADAKNQANKAGNKIDADTLPAVTQLFTEDYMVDFMLHNTLGAWWVSKEGGRWKDVAGIELPYLRTNEDGTPAAGGYEGWPEKVAELKILDPCMGSGHFLVALLPLLAQMRMAEEDLSEADAVVAVLHDNLHGLELDPRCAQLAGFNLALAAWKFSPKLRSETKPLPELHLACCGIAPVGTRDEWLRVLEGHTGNELRFFLGELYDIFNNAPILGSLINPRRLLGGLFDWRRLDDLLDIINTAIKNSDPNLGDRYETGIVVKGIAKAIQLLVGQYHFVPTNVPYLARGKQDQTLLEFIERLFPLGKADLATAFVLRIREFCATGGCATLVTPQNWLFLKSYEKLRKYLLLNASWDWVARLGSGAFDTISGEVTNVSLISLFNTQPDLGHVLAGIDVSAEETSIEKSAALKECQISWVEQIKQLQNPDARISLSDFETSDLISAIATSNQGIPTSDGPAFIRNFWEIDFRDSSWELHQGTSRSGSIFGGMLYAIHFERGDGRLRALSRSQGRDRRRDFQGANAWGEKGVAVNLIGDLSVGLYEGNKFDNNIAAIVPSDPALVPALFCYGTSSTFRKAVRRIDQKMNVTNATLSKVPFDLNHWKKVAAQKYPNGLPEPYSPDPTQWLFKGRIDDTTEPLQVATARLLGYRWPAELDAEKAGVEVFPSDQSHWKGLARLVDDDGIVCLTPLRGEQAASSRLHTFLDEAWQLAKKHPYQLPTNWSVDDVPPAPRAIDFPNAEAWLTHLLEQSGAVDLETYLRDVFFEEHCKLFHHRPFIWHLWDGRPDGFHALVNYHKLAAPDGAGRKVLETLTYSYLGDWIRRQQDDASRGEPGAEDRTLAAQELQNELKNILAGEPPYDLFVRWKPLHEQAIGWEPDINDGVRLNIRPFMLARDMRKKGAGLLRFKPNCKWIKDRGKEPIRPKENFPWFWSWDEKTSDFEGASKHDGNRWNACHYHIETKRAARKQKEEEGS